jgi:hypothetical protein
MSTEQAQWAAQIREIPAIFHMALLSDDHAIDIALQQANGQR